LRTIDGCLLGWLMSSRREGRGLRTGESYLDSGLDDLIRRTLRTSIGREEPSSKVWRGIVEDIRAQAGKKQRAHRGLLHLRSAALAQAVVLITFLLVFSFSLDTSFHVYQTAYQPTPTFSLLEDLSPLGSELDDMLSGLRLARSARKLTVLDYRLAPFAEHPR